MKKRKRRASDATTQKLIDIESKERLSSESIGAMSDQPGLLKEYLEASISNTFSELIFRLTHEIYNEKKAQSLWNAIVAHRESLKSKLDRDIGMLVAALDYLTNISRDIMNPKIMDDSRIEAAAYSATHDSLTSLYLRGVFDFLLDRLIQQHIDSNRSLCVALVDIDNFKYVNDKYGHQTGDKLLRDIGGLLLENTRKGDFPARYGGDEFAIIFPHTAFDAAIVMADRLREGIQQQFADDGPLVTVSIGVACIGLPTATNMQELIRSADRALYKAKASGKNRVAGSA
jgi:diguanylate cyclase (GGDEF)-like protein